MEAVFSGKEVKGLIERKIEQYEKTLETYHETLVYEQKLLNAAKVAYKEKGFWFKFSNPKPTLSAIRGIKSDWEAHWYIYPEEEIPTLEEKISKLEKLKKSLKDDTQVILNENDLLYYSVRE